MTQSLALSSSTQNSEKLNQAGFNLPPPPGVIIPVYLQFNGYRSFCSILKCKWGANLDIFGGFRTGPQLIVFVLLLLA